MVVAYRDIQQTAELVSSPTGLLPISSLTRIGSSTVSDSNTLPLLDLLAALTRFGSSPLFSGKD
jgi:hypothetical protein